MENNFKGGVWPVMLTPFTADDKVDYIALEKLVNWYIEQGVNGLFAVCQSSEMFYLSLEERIEITKFVVKVANKRVPVIASGHTNDNLDEAAVELSEIAKTGIDALILITNRLAKEDESDLVFNQNLQKLMDKIDSDIPLGFYECPYPYKRLISAENIEFCLKSNRFYFLKDTCCDATQLAEKIELTKGTNLKIYNANTTTLLDSLKQGAFGYSGVMANFHAKEYVWLCDNIEHKDAKKVSDALSIYSLIERQYYPVNAKYHLSKLEKLDFDIHTRTKEKEGLTQVFKEEVKCMDRLIKTLNIN